MHWNVRLLLRCKRPDLVLLQQPQNMSKSHLVRDEMSRKSKDFESAFKCDDQSEVNIAQKNNEINTNSHF